MDGLGVRVAKGLNRDAPPRQVLDDRYHGRILPYAPIEVKRARDYLLQNAHKHRQYPIRNTCMVAS